jgi:hypothetical protein
MHDAHASSFVTTSSLAAQRAAGCQPDPWLALVDESHAVSATILDDDALMPDSLVQLQRVVDAFVSRARAARLGTRLPLASGVATFPDQLATMVAMPSALNRIAGGLQLQQGTAAQDVPGDAAQHRAEWLGPGAWPRMEDPSAKEDCRRIREATLASGRVPTGNALARLLCRRPYGSGGDTYSHSSGSSDSMSLPEFTAEVAANAQAVVDSVRVKGTSRISAYYTLPPPGSCPPPSNHRFDPSGGLTLFSPPSSTHSNNTSRPLPTVQRSSFDGDSQPLLQSDIQLLNPCGAGQHDTLPGGGASGVLSSLSGGFSGITLIDREAFSAVLPPTPRSGAPSGRLSGSLPVRRLHLQFAVRILSFVANLNGRDLSGLD